MPKVQRKRPNGLKNAIRVADVKKPARNQRCRVGLALVQFSSSDLLKEIVAGAAGSGSKLSAAAAAAAAAAGGWTSAKKVMELAPSNRHQPNFIKRRNGKEMKILPKDISLVLKTFYFLKLFNGGISFCSCKTDLFPIFKICYIH